MVCPNCSHTLEEVAVDHCRVHRCNKCGGIWFEKDEFEAAKDGRDQDLSWLDFDLWSDLDKLKAGGTFLDCPADGNPLYRIKYGPTEVAVDVCIQCQGIWLDKGELDKIISDLREKVNSETLPEYFNYLEKEVKNLFLDPGHSREELRHIAIITKLIEYRLVAQHPKILEIISALPD